MQLNHRASQICESLINDQESLRVAVHHNESGATLIDCGVDAIGGLEAGVRLAEVCMAGLGRVSLVPGEREIWPGPAIQVATDHPVAACMASQYAGWQISVGKFFGMGSGPMRAAAAREELFGKIGYQEKSDVAVGVIESSKLPTAEVCREIATKCGVKPSALTLLIAPTRSTAGTIQVVARSVETSLHKLYELGFDLGRIASGVGTAPVPPMASDDMAGIGRTNDAILYGGEVTLYVRGDDASLQEFGPRVPSSASADYGRPFAAIFEHYGRDFYKIDPHLFSPAVVALVNLDTGRTFRYGHILPRVIHESFG